MTQVSDGDLSPTLTRRPVSRGTARGSRGLVLMLHGGADHDVSPIGTFHRPWLRSLVMMRRLTPAFHRAGLDVWLLRYRHVGWNARAGEAHSPVPDARWALDQARTAYGEHRPVVLLGHSMGARAAVAVADDPLVRGVVGLAPWWPPDEPVETLRDRSVVAAHGRADRITSFAATEQFLARAAGVASRTELIDMGDLGHYMVRGASRWNATARTHTLQLFPP